MKVGDFYPVQSNYVMVISAQPDMNVKQTNEPITGLIKSTLVGAN